MTFAIGKRNAARRPSWRSALFVSSASVALLLSEGCTGKPVPGLKAVDCPAGDIVLTLSGAKITQKPGSQHSDSITVNVTCSTPSPGGPIANAAIQVTWPGGSTSTGTTDSAGAATISSVTFPTSGGEGTVVVSVNGSDDKSQNEKTAIQ